VANITLIDTDILVDAGRGIDQAEGFIQDLAGRGSVAVSIVTKMELIVGCENKKELRELGQFLERFNVLSLDESISLQAVGLLERYRLSHGLLIADALIAGTAIVWGCALASKNQRDYKYIPEIELLPYP
jgi:predicted nucleic acid-binding protein